MNSEEAILEENKAIARQYKELLRVSYRKLSEADKKLIRKAFDYAIEAHKDQRRKSGEAYIFHPIAVAKIVADEIGLDAPSIAAALLHDVVEDTPASLEEIEKEFGVTIAKIVDGLTKISNIDMEQNISMQAENFRKMLLTLNEDVRVILIKIADRLHNMRTMDSMSVNKQAEKAAETLYIYAPLAHRIGLYNIKTELEDLGLKYTDPDIYNDIRERMIETKEERQQYIKEFTATISRQLDKEKLGYTIQGRPKSIYSIQKKIKAQGISFDEVYDKFAIRIIYKSKPEEEKFLAWKIYSIVTDNFRPNPTRLRDWISSPKSTGYEALHITVMGPKGRWVEVQIRSERMHDIAERGYAAHFKYKHDEENQDEDIEKWLTKLQEALENHEADAIDFVEQFKLNLYAKEIFVFTPQGDIKSLPKDATPLDFAFSIHTDIGLHTRGARVNGKLVPLNHKLKSGDQVEIIKSEHIKPTIKWLEYATSGRALSKIRTALNAEKKEQAEQGKEILRRKLRAQKIPYNDKTITELINYFNLNTSLDLFYRIKVGSIDNIALRKYAASRSNALLSLFKSRPKRTTVRKDYEKQEEGTTNYDQLVFGDDGEQLSYKLSSCCNPIPGDEVFGFLTVNDGIKVHKNNCPNAIQMRSNFAYRIIKAKWIDSTEDGFKALIKLSGIDNMGLVNKVTEEISKNLHVEMNSISFTSNENMFEGNISLKVKNNTILNKLIAKLKEIDGIDTITRE